MTEPNEPQDDRAERALRDALRQHADEPDFQPLHPPTPARGRGGLPRWLPVAAVVVLVAAVAIPLAVGRLWGGSASSAVPAGAQAPERAPQDSASAAAAPSSAARPGWRWESYRVLSYQVPDRWGYAYAPASDWCTGRRERPSEPFVDLAPDRPVAAILCPRDLTAAKLQVFVSVHPVGADRGWDLPSGWTVVSKQVGDYVVEVVHDQEFEPVAEQIIASVRPLAEVDPNGCPARSSLEARTLSSTAGRSAPDQVTLCQYDLSVEPVQLIASKLLTGAAGRAVATELADAPSGSGPDDPSCSSIGRSAALARLWVGPDAADVVVRYAGCQGNGIFDGSDSRRLTAAACHAILQPPLIFSGGSGAAGRLCLPRVDQDTRSSPGPIPSPGPESFPPPSAKPSASRR